jgi:hypothetical protein
MLLVFFFFIVSLGIDNTTNVKNKNPSEHRNLLSSLHNLMLNVVA